MRYVTLALLLFVLFVASCSGSQLEDYGGRGEECYADKTCDEGLECIGGICAPVQVDGDADLTPDGDKEPDTDGDEPVADGDLEVEQDNDRDLIEDEIDDETDNDNPPVDGDLDSEPDTDDDFDSEQDEDPACDCGPDVTDCCDGCNYIIGSCTPADEHAVGGSCNSGECLIDACGDGWLVSVDRRSCEQEVNVKRHSGWFGAGSLLLNEVHGAYGVFQAMKRNCKR